MEHKKMRRARRSVREICLFSKANTSSKEVTVFFFPSAKGMLLQRREERETISTPFRPQEWIMSYRGKRVSPTQCSRLAWYL